MLKLQDFAAIFFTSVKDYFSLRRSKRKVWMAFSGMVTGAWKPFTWIL